MTETEFAELVRRAERRAEADPSGYRRRVMLLAALGYGTILLVLALLIGLLGAVGHTLAAGEQAGIGVAMAKNLGIPALLAAIVIVRALWVRLDPPGGILLDRRQVPALFEALDGLRQDVNGPPLHGVLLTGEFNAAAVQVPRLGFLGWNRNFLVLGLPLMRALSPVQFGAVLAHEYGHLSGAHGRFGAWIYRQRETWIRLQDAVERRRHWSGALLRRFLGWYAPHFNAYTFALARAQEYEADRASANLAGASEAGAALLNGEICARFLQERFWPQVYGRAEHDPEPRWLPNANMGLALRRGIDEADAARWLERALREETGLDDTHPRLRERLAALGVPPSLPAPVGVSAAQALLGKALPVLVESLDSEWIEAVHGQWQERYRDAVAGRGRLAALDAQAAAQPLLVEEAWQRAELAAAHAPERDALPLYRAVIDAQPDHAAARHRAGQLLLARDDETGLAELRRAVALDPESTLASCALALDWLRAHGREAEAGEWLAMRQQREALEQRAAEERADIGDDDRFLPHGLDDDELLPIVGHLARQRRIGRAWLVRKAVNHLPDRPLYVLGVEPARSWLPWQDDQALPAELADGLPIPGEFFVVVFDDVGNRLARRIAGLPGALIHFT